MTEKKQDQQTNQIPADLKIRSQAKQAALKSTDSVYQALVVDAKKDVAKLPENIFKDYFYPYFSGQRSMEPSSPVMGEWIGIAGSPMAEVDIINDQGEVVVTVPPVFDSSIIETVKRKLGESFADVYSQYNLHSRNIPIVGEKYLADKLTEKADQIVNPPNKVMTENQQRWQNIFERYGTPDQSTSNTAKSQRSTPDDDVEYD